MQQSMLANPATPKTTPPRVSSASDAAKGARRRERPSPAPTSAVQRSLFSDAPEHQEPTGGAEAGGKVPAASRGNTPEARPEQGVLAVETWEMDGEASPENVALAETTLARLLVQLWRARQAAPEAGMAAADSGLDFVEPGCPDLSERCVWQNQQAM